MDEFGEDIKPSPLSQPLDLAIVSRQFWDASEPTARPSELIHPVKHVWYIYNIGVPFCKTKANCKKVVKLLQERCMTVMKMTDIPFNFLVGGDGRVYEGRGWFYQPPGFKRFPDEGCDRIDIAYINSDTKKQVSYQMMKSTLDLITLGLNQGYIDSEYQSKEWNRIGEPIEDDPNKPFG
ncbi:peptidoglycan recognition protein-like [Macrosteles quadrilineatus]|uniref:peptidoglycan recognition protein-like n=1 Tax=Macrosteles quadrilineatus TaxID=74068 RepID=UPI0023E26BC0|nr:peptidoglycan recognition protein-like [Macrosteles quadrilineatus]